MPSAQESDHATELVRLRAPVTVCEFDIADPTRLRPVSRTESQAAAVLVRAHGQPIGSLYITTSDQGVTVPAVRAAVLDRLGDQVRALTGIDLRTTRGWDEAAKPTDFASDHSTYLRRADPIAAIICTRDRPLALRRCLESLTLQDHPHFTVWVIDNAPDTKSTRSVLEYYGTRLKIRYVEAPRPGLSKARNVALASDIDAEVVAWIDDDEIADPLWLSEVSRALTDREDAIAVSGLVLPAELETMPQLWFEQYGGHSKGRGYRPTEFSPRTHRDQHPLFPLPSFGSGANMAFRLAALRKAGGFDEALGAGTLAAGAEDTKMFTELLMSGATVLYRPSAITRHYHRRDASSLERQMIGYGTGLTAYYSALLINHPAYLWPLARLAPRGLKELMSRDGLREATTGPDFPRAYLNAHRRALLRGPSSYLRQRWMNRRTAERRQEDDVA